jgi:hypothetical protein
MSLQHQQRLSLVDHRGHDLGKLIINWMEGNLVFGQFIAGPDYPAAAELFGEYVEAANQQLLSMAGKLDGAIAKLGMKLPSREFSGLPTLYDMQIGEGGITFRTRPQEESGSPISADAPSAIVTPEVS